MRGSRDERKRLLGNKLKGRRLTLDEGWRVSGKESFQVDVWNHQTQGYVTTSYTNGTQLSDIKAPERPKFRTVSNYLFKSSADRALEAAKRLFCAAICRGASFPSTLPLLKTVEYALRNHIGCCYRPQMLKLFCEGRAVIWEQLLEMSRVGEWVASAGEVSTQLHIALGESTRVPFGCRLLVYL